MRDENHIGREYSRKMNIKEIKKDIKERLWGSKLEYFEVIEVK